MKTLAWIVVVAVALVTGYLCGFVDGWDAGAGVCKMLVGG